MNKVTLHKIDMGTSKIENKIVHSKRRAKQLIFSPKVGFLFALLGMVLAFIAFMWVSAWYDTHRVRFQTPIIFQWPVIIEKRVGVLPSREVKKVTPTPIAVNGTYNKDTGQVTAGMTEGQVAYEAYKTVRFHESSNGKDVGLNHFCKGMGMLNEVGYDPSHNFCFHSETEQTATVVNWFRNCLDKSSVSSCLGTYSSGSYTDISYE